MYFNPLIINLVTLPFLYSRIKLLRGSSPHIRKKTVWCVMIVCYPRVFIAHILCSHFLFDTYTDIGDRIATSNPKSDTNVNGSPTWYVDSVTLFTTTVRFATTNETATYSNGSLAALRIINANRSPKAIISVLIKFGLETPFTKITVFRTAVENFIKARPREWISLVGFRATRVEADVGYIEYKIVVQHRESWQNIGPVLQSKADLSSFCLEATKKLDMKYESPPMPVNLSTSGELDMNLFQGDGNNLLRQRDGGGDNVQSVSAEDLQEVANLFEIRKKKRR